MNPLAAVWRWCKAALYLITGQIDKSRRVLDKNPSVMQAKFDDIIKGKVDQIHTYNIYIQGRRNGFLIGKANSKWLI